MKPKWKLIWIGPIHIIRALRARRIAKKIVKYEDEERYPQQWRNDYVLKRAKRLLKMLNVKLVVEGYETIPKNTSVFAINHVSNIDPVVILAALENPGQASDDHNIMPVFLAKKELQKNWQFSGFLDIINTFYLDRSRPREALETLNEIAIYAKTYKKHIIVFPEGTRSKDGTLQSFKSGAFRIAKKSFTPIVPVTIHNTFDATKLNRKGKLEVKVIFHTPLKPLTFIAMQPRDIATKVQNIIKRELIKQSQAKDK